MANCKTCWQDSRTDGVILCRMHAAAPALLEALEGLLETSAIKWRDYHDDTAVRSARAAIRAAKGEGENG